MSAFRLWYIDCDHDLDCPEEEGGYATLREAWAAAKDSGWRRERRTDGKGHYYFCRQHGRERAA